MKRTDSEATAASLSARGGREHRAPMQAMRARADALVRRIAAWRRCRCTRLELEAMSEYEAHDLGLEIGGARDMAMQPI